tara:strand:- start:1336 stop:3438 length:2103 start_codon:yes stop_codon:yes gene_type:complete
VAQANVKLTVDATSATRALKGVQNQSNQLQKSFGGLKTAIAGIGFTVLAKNVISTTANLKTLQLRMKGLTSEYGEYAQVQELVTKAQNKFNLSIVEATKSVTDIFARLRPLGIELREIETAFMGFNTIAVAAGLNANEMNAAFTQLAQGLGSGRLQGDEFRSIAEQIPQLLSAISKETGIASGKLKDFASKGLLKTDIIIRALANSTEKYQDTVDNIIKNSPEAAFKAFSNAALELQLTLGDKLLPSIVAITKASTAFVKAITDFVDSEAGQVTLAFIGIAAAIKGVTVVGTILATQIGLLKASFFSMSMAAAAANGTLATTTTMAFATAGGFAKATAAATAFKIALAKTGIGLIILGLGYFTAELLKAINAQKEFNKVLEKGTVVETKEKIKEYRKEIEKLEARIAKANVVGFILRDWFLRGAGNASDMKNEISQLEEKIKQLQKSLELKEELKLAKDFDKVRRSLLESNEELKNIIEKSKLETEEKRKQFDLDQRKNELIAKYGEDLAEVILKQEEKNRELKKGVDKIKEQEEAAKKLAETFEKIGDSIATGVSDALVDAVMQTKSLADSARALLNDIARQLMRLGINTLLFNTFGGAEGIFKNLKTFSTGGRPPVGRPSIVGEKGPELFVPSRAGTIIPNNQLGGGALTNNIVVNVDMDGGIDAEGAEQEGRELGRLIAVAVQSEIIQQKRAGGLLA